MHTYRSDRMKTQPRAPGTSLLDLAIHRPNTNPTKSSNTNEQNYCTTCRLHVSTTCRNRTPAFHRNGDMPSTISARKSLCAIAVYYWFVRTKRATVVAFSPKPPPPPPTLFTGSEESQGRAVRVKRRCPVRSPCNFLGKGSSPRTDHAPQDSLLGRMCFLTRHLGVLLLERLSAQRNKQRGRLTHLPINLAPSVLVSLFVAHCCHCPRACCKVLRTGRDNYGGNVD